MTLRSDRGSGSLLAVALAGAIATLTALVVPLYMSLAIRQSVAAAADAAALAAADTASGLLPGFPCEQAATVAAANGSALRSCEADGLVVTVSVERPLLGIAVTATATAGPPPGGSGLGSCAASVCMVSLSEAAFPPRILT